MKKLILLSLFLAGSVGADIHSGNRAFSRGYHEINPIGSPACQVTGSVLTVGVAYYLERKAPKKFKWVGKALVTGATTVHTAAAVHNYRLK